MRVLIINSDGYQDMGFVTEAAAEASLVDALRRAEVDVEVTRVASVEALEAALDGLPGDTLVWPNAYHVGPDARSLQAVIEARGLPIVGSPAPTLELVLHKERCQARLAAAGVPVPPFAVVTRADLDAVATAARSLRFPIIVKPTATAGSLGIDRRSVVDTIDAAAAAVARVLDEHGPPALLEEYLPSNDITFAVFLRGDARRVVATWYEMTDRPPGSTVLERCDRLRAWGGPKRMRLVEDPALLDEISALAPRVCEALGVRDFTRIDGRRDRDGRLRVFDVNGLPALDFPESAIVRQAIVACAPEGERRAFDRLIRTIVACAAHRCGLRAPPAIERDALFAA